jgi:anti-sigma regulatory factor (Ser/Thr protein kinase)
MQANIKDDNEVELLKLSVPAETKFVSFVRHAVQNVIEQFVPETQSVPDIMLAVGEACNNAVLHKHSAHNVSLNISCRVNRRSSRPADYDRLTIEIRNTGDGFYNVAQSKSYSMPPAELLDDHGRGMPLMQMLVDHVEVIGDRNDTVVRLTKHL